MLQVGGGRGRRPSGNGAAPARSPLLGNALGPVAKTILETSAVLPELQSMMKFADADGAEGRRA